MDHRQSPIVMTLPVLIAIVIATTGPALAHHAMGGETPTTIFEGLISGLAHPVIGVDHLAFVIGAGIAAAFLPFRLMLPGLFVAGTVAGCLLVVSGFSLPAQAAVVAASVIFAGTLVMSGARPSVGELAALFLVAGLFHGGAYAESIIGAEEAPLVAYLVGFAIIQYVVAAGAMLLVRQVWHSTSTRDVPPRLAGALIAGVGCAFLVNILTPLVVTAVFGA